MIYVIADYPAQYEEELQVWEVVPLHGRLDRLLRDYGRIVEGWQDRQLILPGF
jgi:hypothetical protein